MTSELELQPALLVYSETDRNSLSAHAEDGVVSRANKPAITGLS
jgi:hypothetical protein